MAMNMDEKIKRINELYHKSKSEGLTEQEKEEQARLRREYVESIRGNLRSQLNSMTIQYEDGSREKVSDRKKRVDAQRHLEEEDEKRALRKKLLALRDALAEEQRKRGEVLITERILGHQWFYLSDMILGFVSYGSEIETREILKEALAKGKKLYLPKVTGHDEMKFYRVTSLEELKEGYKGILEPDGTSEEYVYDEESAKKTLLLMPGVGFDAYGNRLGYGKGFYDRFLEGKDGLQIRSIAIGHSCQKAEKIPVDPKDIKPYQVILV
ncbi:MAG: 5-formyltetrahydrofolate cyclo-ligase [Lachnospiraceae bacterium]|nr:5-formyltetrahydrofolate cyclo-ligase [Lachnospiraceae bacterium]